MAAGRERSVFQTEDLMRILYPQDMIVRRKHMFVVLGGGLLVIIIAVVIAVVSSVVSAVAADVDDSGED